MKAGLNRVQLIGNLGEDPEFREAGNGDSVCNFRVATTALIGKGTSRREHKEWHRVVTWGRLAELCAEQLKAGSAVYVDGRLSTRTREDRHGNRKTNTDVVANDVIFL
jgi:single-strand DNA-binding protein